MHCLKMRESIVVISVCLLQDPNNGNYLVQSKGKHIDWVVISHLALG